MVNKAPQNNRFVQMWPAQYISFNLTLPKQLCRCVSLDPLKQYLDVDFDPQTMRKI